MDKKKPVKLVYTPNDLKQFDSEKELGLPGEFPFTRGIYPSMYREQFWTMRQYSGFGTASETNKRYKFLLSQGQTGLSVAFDLPTQLGLDSDDSRSRGEVGKVGVAIDSLEDMETLFEGIPLDKVSVSMTINATAAIILSMYFVMAEKRSISWDSLSGTIQNDILKEYIARGTYIYPPESSLKICMDTIAFCQKNAPRWNTMSISGYHIREAGATAVQELSFTFANAIAYVNGALDAGLEIDSFAPRLSFFLASHNDFFEEIAKFRAARRIWARLMREKFKAKKPLSWKFRFHTQTSGATLTAQEAENNVIRVALQALAAVLGGTQSLHTNSRDEALALPSEESAQIALRTQQIIALESGVASTVDPVGGSYYLETLTNSIERSVDEYLQKIEDMGGALQVIQKGYMQKEIQESAYEYQKQIEDKERIVIGVNQYADSGQKPSFQLYAHQEEREKKQVKSLQRFKKSRNEDNVRDKLAGLERTIEEGQNLLPGLIQSVKARATLGEISAALIKKFGTYTENVHF